MPAPHRDNTILLNGVVYDLAPGAFRTLELPAPPPLREGSPATGAEEANSVVGWRDWSDGGFAVTYDPSQPARIGEAKDIIIDVPYQLTLSMLQQACTGINEAPTKILQPRPGDRMMAVSATKVWIKAAGSEAWSSIATGITPTDLLAWGDGTNTLYLVANGTGAYRYTTDPTAGTVTWAESSLGGDLQKADFFASGPEGLGAGAGTLWKAVKPNKVYSTDDPKNTTGHWSSPYLVGGSETNITSLAVLEDRLLVGKEDGLYWVQPDGTVQPLIDMRAAADSANCAQMVSWGGYLFVNWLQGLYVLSGRNLLNLGEVTASFRDVGPHVGNQEGGDIRGRVVAMLGAPTRLYVVLRSESDKYSINRYNGDPRPGFGWNPGFLWLDTSACNALGWEQPASGNPRLYFGRGAAIYYAVLPRFGDNPLLDSNCRYAASGSCQMPEHESPYRAMQKSMLYVALDLERASAGARYADVSYKIDNEGTIPWATLGRFETNGLAKKYFSTTEYGRRMKLQITLATTASANTPRVRLIEHHYDLRSEVRRRWQFAVVAGKGTSHPTRTAANTRKALETARASYQPVGFTDRYGELWDAFVESVGDVEVEKLPGEREPVAAIAITAREFKSGVGAYYVGDENAIVGSCYAS